MKTHAAFSQAIWDAIPGASISRETETRMTIVETPGGSRFEISDQELMGSGPDVVAARVLRQSLEAQP